jgi:transketolase
MVGIAAGLSKQGLIPFVHTIAPFLVERAFEQLKIDFGYQGLRGNFVSVGASSDYSSLGCTHHCPGDVAMLQNIPGFEIFAPGTSSELAMAIKTSYQNKNPTYYRLSEMQNSRDFSKQDNGGTLVKSGSKCTVIVFGPLLDITLEAIENLDVELIYIYRIQPLDENLIRKSCKSGRILLVEPFYSNTMTYKISGLFTDKTRIMSVGYPREFLRNYGSLSEHLDFVGLTPQSIRKKIEELMDSR